MADQNAQIKNRRSLNESAFLFECFDRLLIDVSRSLYDYMSRSSVSAAARAPPPSNHIFNAIFPKICK
jgi:hypothetical protein